MRSRLTHLISFFSFLDPTATNPSLTPTTSPSTPISALPKAVPQTLSHHHRTDSTSLPANPTQSLRSRYAHLPLPLRVMVAFAFHTPTATQLKLVVGFATLFLGGALWIFGQAGESLATTGLGYLVVFDGVGALSRIWVEGRAEGIDKVWDAAGASTHGHCGLRLPFGWVCDELARPDPTALTQTLHSQPTTPSHTGSLWPMRLPALLGRLCLQGGC